MFNPKEMELNPKVQSSRGGRSANIDFQIGQTVKANKSEEMVIRGAASYFKKASMAQSDKVLVLHDANYNVWIIEKTDKAGGYQINGKDDAPTLFIRYTLKDGMARVNEAKESDKIEIDKDNIYVEEGKIYLNAAKA